jgi:hypothetical protein
MNPIEVRVRLSGIGFLSGALRLRLSDSRCCARFIGCRKSKEINREVRRARRKRGIEISTEPPESSPRELQAVVLYFLRAPRAFAVIRIWGQWNEETKILPRKQDSPGYL